ncbi:hypothetical protein OCU04_006452 [Sclerotinia nivalis]|uniref:Uncharacterized protein n=1 Tax=Sclerotinia nivalis TaxID=352851 RepID=A0A9X0AN22_9HELO|nr:hypothetical protein OCU04_006452 [Sclerotinia nivalis]
MTFPGRNPNLRDSEQRASISGMELSTSSHTENAFTVLMTQESTAGYQNQNQNQNQPAEDSDRNNEHEQEQEQRGRPRTRSSDHPPNSTTTNNNPSPNPSPPIPTSPPLPISIHPPPPSPNHTATETNTHTPRPFTSISPPSTQITTQSIREYIDAYQFMRRREFERRCMVRDSLVPDSFSVLGGGGLVGEGEGDGDGERFVSESDSHSDVVASQQEVGFDHREPDNAPFMSAPAPVGRTSRLRHEDQNPQDVGSAGIGPPPSEFYASRRERGNLQGQHQNPQVEQEPANGSVGIESLPAGTQNPASARQNLRPIPIFGPESWNELASEARDRSTSPLARNNAPTDPPPIQTRNIHQEDTIVSAYPYSPHPAFSAQRPINGNPYTQDSSSQGLPPADDDSTLSHAQRRWFSASMNESTLVFSERSDVLTSLAQAQTQTQAPEFESNSTRGPEDPFLAIPPPRPRLDIGRSLLRIEERIEDLGQRYSFEVMERRHVAETEGSVEQLAVINRQNVYPSIADALFRLQRDLNRVREVVHRTAETRSVSPSSEGEGMGVGESGFDRGGAFMRSWSPVSVWGDNQNTQSVTPMREQLGTFQMDTQNNEFNPRTYISRDVLPHERNIAFPDPSHRHMPAETNNPITNISRNISPHERRDTSPHPPQPRISTDHANEIANIEARNRASAERTEHEIARMRWTVGPPQPNRSSILPHEENVRNASRSTPRVPNQTSREASDAMNGIMNPHTPRLRPSTSYENLRLQRQLAALLPSNTQNDGTSQTPPAPRARLSDSQLNPIGLAPDPDRNISPPPQVPDAPSRNSSQSIASDPRTSSPHPLSRSHRSHRSPSRERSISPMAQQQFDAMRSYRDYILSQNPITVHDHLAKWQFYLEKSAWRIDGWFSEEWLHREGQYTLIPPASSSISIEDVSGSIRLDEEILIAYSLNTSCGVKEILRLVVEDGMYVREAWYYIELWKEFILEWSVDILI